jgi:hypothetical protein
MILKTSSSLNHLFKQSFQSLPSEIDNSDPYFFHLKKIGLTRHSDPNQLVNHQAILAFRFDIPDVSNENKTFVLQWFTRQLIVEANSVRDLLTLFPLEKFAQVAPSHCEFES